MGRRMLAILSYALSGFGAIALICIRYVGGALLMAGCAWLDVRQEAAK